MLKLRPVLPANDTYEDAWPCEPVAGTSRAPGSKVIIDARLRLRIGNCTTSVCRITVAWPAAGAPVLANGDLDLTNAAGSIELFVAVNR